MHSPLNVRRLQKKKSSAARKSYLEPKETDAVEIGKLMDVPPLPEDDNGAKVASHEYDSSSSSSGSAITEPKTRRKRQRQISSDSAGDGGSDKSSSNSRGGSRKQQLGTAADKSSTLPSTTVKGKETLKTKQKTVIQVDEASESPTETVSRTGIPVPPIKGFDKSSSNYRDRLRQEKLETTADKSSPLPSTTLKGKKTSQTKQAVVIGVKAHASSTETVSGSSKKGTMPSTHDEDEASITKYLRSLAIQQTKTTDAITELKLVIESIRDKLNLDQAGNATESQQRSEIMLAEKLGMTFPLQNVEDFERFDVALKSPTLKELLRKEMLCLMEMKLPLQRNIGNVLKKYMSRDLIRSYTAVKKTAGKGVLKSTNLYQRIQENMTSEYSKNPKLSPISDKKFADAVGAVINSAKDWEGRRLMRSTKSSSDSTEAAPKETAAGEIIAEETDVNAEAATKETDAIGEATTKDSEQI